MKKRTTVLIAAFLAAAAVFAGCSELPKSPLDPKNPTSVTIWHYYNDAQRNAFDLMVTEFNETVGAKEGIVVQHATRGGVNELIKSVRAAANKEVGADDMPDMFLAYADTAYEIDQLGLVAELDPYFTEEELAEYIDGYIEEGRFDKGGSLKIFPVAKSTEVLMLNKTDWERFTNATPGVSTADLATYEGITGVAKKYYEWTASAEGGGEGKALFGRDAFANYIITGCKQLGMEVFSVQGGEVTFQVEKEKIRRLWDNYYVPFVNGYFQSDGKFRSDDAKTGKIIAMICSSSGAAFFPNEVRVTDDYIYPIECLTLPVPVFAGGEKVAVQQGAGMVVVKTDEKTQYAAARFLKWFTEKERNIEFAVNSGYIPVKKEANDMEVIRKVAQEAGMQFSKALESALPVSVQTASHYQIYTNKAFKNGTAARAVLEDSMSNLAKADAERARAFAAESNISLSEAVARLELAEDENFETWYSAFCAALEALK